MRLRPFDRRALWRYRALPKLLFLHYNDMSDDLAGEMARLADFLAIERSPSEIQAMCKRARFEATRAKADDLAPGLRTQRLR